jgi:hypothetical protein
MLDFNSTPYRQARARVWWDYAVEPQIAIQMAQRFAGDGNLPPPPPTVDDVRKQFGDKAAKAWQTAKDAREEFFKAVEKTNLALAAMKALDK